MATVSTLSNEKTLSLKKWLGLHEAPDGDTKLKDGEGCRCENWKVTRDGNLQRRPGTQTVETELRSRMIFSSKIYNLWYGLINGSEHILCVSSDADGAGVFEIYHGSWKKERICDVEPNTFVNIFGFNDMAYIMDGVHYIQYDGTTAAEVEGYRPLIITACLPNGSGTLLEQVNKLNGLRRIQFSPDGSSTVFHLPKDADIESVDYIKSMSGDNIPDYTVDVVNATVTFNTAPTAGTVSIEIGYTVSDTFRDEVVLKRYSELYNGTQDTRVFLYGDGTNKCLYSGIDEYGNPRADYFPDENECVIGASNTPITAMIRHLSRLIVYKTDSAYSMYYGTITTEAGLNIPAFTINTINKAIGCDTYGQVQLVDNFPRTLFQNDLYEWKNTSYRSANLTADERQAVRISDRIHRSLSVMNTADCVCFDDNANNEYYICYGNNALVNNYAVDAWYLYTGLNFTAFCSMGSDLYAGVLNEDGTAKVVRMSSAYKSDDGEVINAYWESGAMDFGQDYMRKYTSRIWITTKPETNSYLRVTAITDRRSLLAEKEIKTGTGGFSSFDFSSFSFSDSAESQVKRLKIKAKKYTRYKLILINDKLNTSATVGQADIRIRTTGDAK